MMQRNMKETEVTSQVSLVACRQERCAGTSEIGQTTKEESELHKNKDSRQSSSQCTAGMRWLLCHTQNTPSV